MRLGGSEHECINMGGQWHQKRFIWLLSGFVLALNLGQISSSDVSLCTGAQNPWICQVHRQFNLKRRQALSPKTPGEGRRVKQLPVPDLAWSGTTVLASHLAPQLRQPTRALKRFKSPLWQDRLSSKVPLPAPYRAKKGQILFDAEDGEPDYYEEGLPHEVGSNNDYSEDSIDRIYKGWQLYPHEFPWMVKIKTLFPRDQEGNARTRTCGGALLNQEWVVTARHCVTWSPSDQPGHLARHGGVPASAVWVFLGGHDNFGEDGLVMMADKAIGRPDYGRPQCPSRQGICSQLDLPPLLKDSVFTNDIALVRLSRPAPFNQAIQPIRLPIPFKDYSGSRAFVAGWGIQNVRRRPSSVLKAAELEVIDGLSARGCRNQSGWGKMCARSSDGSGRGSSCPGDSGSPLVTWDQDNEGWTIIGLLSNGAKSCFKGAPEVYTRVSDYLKWMNINMSKHSRFSNTANSRRPRGL